jgi:hypothetical protein
MMNNPALDERHGSQMWLRMRDTPYTRGEIAFGGWNSKEDHEYGNYTFKGEATGLKRVVKV